MNIIRILFTILIVLIAGETLGLSMEPISHKEIKEPMKLKEALVILQKSENPLELEAAAVSLCMIGTDDALDRLTAFLRSPDFLERLSLPRVNYVLEAIAKLSTPKAEDVLLKLAEDEKFANESDQVDGLIRACGWFQHPSTKLLSFLDSKGGGKESLCKAGDEILGSDWHTGSFHFA